MKREEYTFEQMEKYHQILTDRNILIDISRKLKSLELTGNVDVSFLNDLQTKIKNEINQKFDFSKIIINL